MKNILKFDLDTRILKLLKYKVHNYIKTHIDKITKLLNTESRHM